MSLRIETFILGPIENNTYLLSDTESKNSVLIDPAAPSKKIIHYLEYNSFTLKEIWLTHAHFDHIGGVRWFMEKFSGKIQTALHKEDIPLWKVGGSAWDFGFEFDPGPTPEKMLTEKNRLSIGNYEFAVFHTPGHTNGHVTFYSAQKRIAFCGDLIFSHGIGRTDLPISNTEILMNSIKQKIFTLPDETILYPGHGQFTTVQEEKNHNPFFQ